MMRTSILSALMMLFCWSTPALGQHQEPVPPPMSPCSQGSDENADGLLESITYYVYDSAGALTDTVVDDGNAREPEAWQHLTIGDHGSRLFGLRTRAGGRNIATIMLQ